MSSLQTVVATFTVPVVPLGAALDNSNLTWTTGGDASFFAQTAFSNFGGSAVQSGRIGNSQSSFLSTSVTGPGVLTFDWKVSSEQGFDIFSVQLDGAQATVLERTDQLVHQRDHHSGRHAHGAMARTRRTARSARARTPVGSTT